MQVAGEVSKLVYDDIFQLVDGTLKSGLPYVNSHLEKQIGTKVIFVDGGGFVLAPFSKTRRKRFRNSCLELPDLAQTEYIYAENEKTLYYGIPWHEDIACAVVRELGASQIEFCLSALRKAELAVKLYFSRLNQARSDALVFEKELEACLFGGSNLPISDIMTLGGHTPLALPYFVEILEFDPAAGKAESAASQAREYLRQHAADGLVVRTNNRLALIAPQGNAPFDTGGLQATLEKQLSASCRMGRGDPHILADLRQSADEARLALHYPNLMGIETNRQYFSNMGIFSIMLSRDLRAISRRCREKLAPLRSYDQNSDSELMLTLGELINSDFNLKKTAQNLYIHINTLYYRTKRIGQLLNLDLSLMSDRLDIFAAYKTLALLEMSGLRS
ncbi:MAG: helix-turn-helix domain-containing protein [Gracilibacteraceae bacterium]|jgi:hypothetical protein|nr:helix-turn-helix domain-containing protein [Gracilibacteraceae bacterium]